MWGDATSPVTEHDVPKIVWDIWTKINFDQDRSIVRAYVNAYTYGTEGSIHTDSDRDDSKTHLIYINPSWKPEWAGETVFFVNNEIFRAILPKPGRMVEFPGNIPHDARSVSRLSNVLRKVLVYKSMPCS